MSTRSIILVTGKNETTRLYKLSDGYPTGNLPIIADALNKANEQCKAHSKKWDCEKTPSVDQVVGLIIGAATCEYGMGARIDQNWDDDSQAVFNESFKQTHLGDQSDLDWIYIVNVDEKSVNVYGGGYTDCSPQEHFKKGFADPVKYANQLRDEFIDDERKAIKDAVKAVQATGFSVNEPKGRGPKSATKQATKSRTTKKSSKARKSNVIRFPGAKSKNQAGAFPN